MFLSCSLLTATAALSTLSLSLHHLKLVIKTFVRFVPQSVSLLAMLNYLRVQAGLPPSTLAVFRTACSRRADAPQESENDIFLVLHRHDFHFFTAYRAG